MFGSFVLFLAVLAAPVIIWLVFWAIFLGTKMLSRRRQLAANAKAAPDKSKV